MHQVKMHKELPPNQMVLLHNLMFHFPSDRNMPVLVFMQERKEKDVLASRLSNIILDYSFVFARRNEC